MNPYTSFTPEQTLHLEGLLKTISNDQSIWLSGYFAGLTAKHSATALPQQHRLTILYGSLTGKAVEIATLAAQKSKSLGMDVQLQDAAEFTAHDLTQTSRLLLVVSTHGKGTPPFSAKGLYDYLFSKQAPKLNALQYAVVALGDSAYDHFCQAGIDFDRQLEALGAIRLLPLHLGDVDVDQTVPTWIDQVLPLFEGGKVASTPPRFSFLKKSSPSKKPTSFIRIGKLNPTFKTQALPSKSNPFPAAVLNKYNLNTPDSDRKTIHLELDVDTTGMNYQPGDSAGIIPLNHPDLIREVLQATGFDGSQIVSFKDRKRTLESLLQDSVELSKVTQDVVKKYLPLCPSEALHKLAENREQLSEYIAGRDIVDLLTDFPVSTLQPETLLSVLRPLQPRFYSISSSPLAFPGKMHLTVGVVTHQHVGRTHNGTCSGYLSEIRMEDEFIPVFVEPNPQFRLPEDPTKPIIMVAAGTGIAPFRAFVQHRSHTPQAGKSWLFFGNRNQTSEFLYEKEWSSHLASGALTRMDVAFSRDGNAKKYVQECLLEQASDVYQWLEQGAHLYLCGDANGLATDVQKTLQQIISEQGHYSLNEAESYLDALQSSGRFQLDVY